MDRRTIIQLNEAIAQLTEAMLSLEQAEAIGRDKRRSPIDDELFRLFLDQAQANAQAAVYVLFTVSRS